MREEDNELLGLFVNTLNIINSWLRFITAVIRWRRNRKRRLFKPHLMLPFMQGFQMRVISRDLWATLEQNWVHFFWLTGESPQTLNALVVRLRNLFFVHNNFGRNPIIDFRNQVSIKY